MLCHKGSKDFCCNTHTKVSVHGPLTQVAHGQYTTSVHMYTNYLWVCVWGGGGWGKRKGVAVPTKRN